jgi:hypothetical protein
MSNPPGIDLDQLFSRLHTGMCGLQSWRDHRRARQADAAPTAPASPTVVAAASIPTMPSPHGPLEPQGFVDIGGRLFPVYGDLRSAPSATSTTTEPPASSPAPTITPPSPSTAPASPVEAPRPTRLNAAVLKMPLPTPPACLSRTSAQPADDGEPAPTPATEPTPTVPSSATMGVPSIAPTLEAMLQRRSDAEAARLEQVHAEHRALLAALLSEHRAQLAEQAEAAARREHQLVRDLLAEHRAQLEAQAEAMRKQQSQHHEDLRKIVAATDQAAEAHAQSITDLQALLAEQVKRQAQAYEQTEHHIGDLADVLGGLGQTVAQLAAATFERKREPTLLLPPQLAAPGPVPVMPWPPSPTASVAIHPAQPSNLPPSPAPAVEVAPPPASPDTSSTRPPPMRVPRHEAPDAQTRVAALVDDFDDDDLDDIDDPDDPPPRARLSPITALDRIESSEPAHG